MKGSAWDPELKEFKTVEPFKQLIYLFQPFALYLHTIKCECLPWLRSMNLLQPSSAMSLYNAVALVGGIGLLTDVSGLLNDNVMLTWVLSKNKRSFIALWILQGRCRLKSALWTLCSLWQAYMPRVMVKLTSILLSVNRALRILAAIFYISKIIWNDHLI